MNTYAERAAARFVAENGKMRVGQLDRQLIILIKEVARDVRHAAAEIAQAAKDPAEAHHKIMNLDLGAGDAAGKTPRAEPPLAGKYLTLHGKKVSHRIAVEAGNVAVTDCNLKEAFRYLQSKEPNPFVSVTDEPLYRVCKRCGPEASS